MWRALGQVGLMEARRQRDKLAAEVQGDQPVGARTRATFGELAAEWLVEQRARLEAGGLSPRTFESYEMALRRHVLPVFGSRQVRGITVEQLVDWIRRLRAAGYSPHSVHNYWAPINLVLRYAVRHGVLAGNPADRLTSSERPKPGSGRKRSSIGTRCSGCSMLRPTATGSHWSAGSSQGCVCLSCSASCGTTSTCAATRSACATRWDETASAARPRRRPAGAT